MPGATPNRAWPYPLPGDNPAALGDTFGALALAIDAYSATLDIDQARVAANAFVKVSITEAPLGASPPVFNTVEINRNTPTDLSIVNGLIIPPAFWVIGSTVTYEPAIAATQLEASLFYSPVPAASPFVTRPDVSGRDITGVAVSSSSTVFNSPNQTLSLIDFLPVTAQTNVTLSLATGSWAWQYIDLWAFQIGDL